MLLLLIRLILIFTRHVVADDVVDFGFASQGRLAWCEQSWGHAQGCWCSWVYFAIPKSFWRSLF